MRIDRPSKTSTPMFSVRVETVIQRPIEEVFAFIADAENDPRWCPSVKEIERVVGEKPGAGARYRMLHAPGGMKFKATVETTVFEPSERIEWLMNDGGHRLHIIYELAAVEGGLATRLKQTSHVETRGWLRIPGRLLKGYIGREMEKEMKAQFEKLKHFLEENAA